MSKFLSLDFFKCCLSLKLCVYNLAEQSLHCSIILWNNGCIARWMCVAKYEGSMNLRGKFLSQINIAFILCSADPHIIGAVIEECRLFSANYIEMVSGKKQKNYSPKRRQDIWDLVFNLYTSMQCIIFFTTLHCWLLRKVFL